MNLSNLHFDPDLPYWRDILPFLDRLCGPGFPSCAQLNALLPGNLCSADGNTIRFVDSRQLDDEAYEQRIYTTGQVSTRADSWHDFFNALIWMRFAHIKTAMNCLHFQSGAALKRGSRGQLRDALTLFDECGVIVFSNRLEILEALAQRRWSDAFQADAFPSSVGIAVCGHAMLEKYLSPYKAMTAKALLIHTKSDFMNHSRQQQLELLDREVAKGMLSDDVLSKPASLSPLPLAGIPGWWPLDEQSADSFYLDLQVFRPPPADFTPAPVLTLSKNQAGQTTFKHQG